MTENEKLQRIEERLERMEIILLMEVRIRCVSSDDWALFQQRLEENLAGLHAELKWLPSRQRK